jgi:hypothetical protein
VKFGRVMSDPAMREQCKALKVGDSTTADVTQGFKVVVTRLEGGELEIAVRSNVTRGNHANRRTGGSVGLAALCPGLPGARSMGPRRADRAAGQGDPRPCRR